MIHGNNSPYRRKVTAADVIKHREFQIGYREAKAGITFDADRQHFGQHYSDRKNGAWTYERGRQFARIYTGRLLQGRGVCKAAERALIEATIKKDII